MDKLHLVCVDENAEVTFNLLRDLAPLSKLMTLSQCNCAEDALKKIDEIDRQGDFLVLIISGLLSTADSSISLLEHIAEDTRFHLSKRILISDDTSKQVLINAINVAHVNRFYEYNWNAETLLKQATVLATKYIFAKGLDYEKYQTHLDSETILKRIRNSI